MANKYQKALDELIKYTSPINPEDVDTLQELVNKAEYKAPVQVAHVYGTIIECPVCHQPITSLGLYCANCGQRIKPYEND